MNGDPDGRSREDWGGAPYPSEQCDTAVKITTGYARVLLFNNQFPAVERASGPLRGGGLAEPTARARAGAVAAGWYHRDQAITRQLRRTRTASRSAASPRRRVPGC